MIPKYHKILIADQFQLDRFLNIMYIYNKEFILIGHNNTIYSFVELDGFYFESFKICSPCECGQFFNDKDKCVCSLEEVETQLSVLNKMNFNEGIPRFIVIDHFNSENVLSPPIYESLEQSAISNKREKFGAWEKEFRIDQIKDLITNWEDNQKDVFKKMVNKLQIPLHFLKNIFAVAKVISILNDKDDVQFNSFMEATNYFQFEEYKY